MFDQMDSLNFCYNRAQFVEVLLLILFFALFSPLIKGLLAANVNQIKCSETMKFLLSRQNPDGSFMNLGATIYVMQSLVGALPYDVNKIACPENEEGKKIKRGPANRTLLS